MPELVENTYFRVCLSVGRLLRSARYSSARIVSRDAELEARKIRFFYAPLLIRVGGALFRVLDTGVRVLPQREWEEQERQMYGFLHRTSIGIEADGTLVLPCLAGRTLATLLEDPELEESARRRAIELTILALAELHDLGITHGDAMAENVMVDLEGGIAHWFDFETIHDSDRSLAWRRADDVRALLATSLLRTPDARLAERLRLILDVYADENVTRLVGASFGSVCRRSLPFHLGQAGLTLQRFREITQLFSKRLAESPRPPARESSTPKRE